VGSSRLWGPSPGLEESPVRAGGVVCPPRGVSPWGLPGPQSSGAVWGCAWARGWGEGWRCVLASGDNAVPQGTFSGGSLARSPLRAAEGHCDGLHGLLELPLVRLIVGFVMETWKRGSEAALSPRVPVSGRRSCRLPPVSALPWGWGWVRGGEDHPCGRWTFSRAAQCLCPPVSPGNDSPASITWLPFLLTAVTQGCRESAADCGPVLLPPIQTPAPRRDGFLRQGSRHGRKRNRRRQQGPA